MYLLGNLPLDDHNLSNFPSMSRLSLLIKYFFRVFGSKLTIYDVHLIKRPCLVLLLTIDSDNTQQATLQSYEQDVLPIDMSALTRYFTI